MVLLLAVLVGRPQDARQVFTVIMSAPTAVIVWDALSCFPTVVDELAAVRALPHMAILTVETCQRWAPSVSRFSFRLSTVVSEGAARPHTVGLEVPT